MTEPRVIHVHQKKKAGFGCGGCLLVLVALWGLGEVNDWWERWRGEQREEERREQLERGREELRAELVEFAQEQAPALQRAIDDLRALVERRREQLAQLEEKFRALGRDPSADDDWRRWTDQLAELEGKLEELLRMREDAYLMWQKFLVSQEPGERERYEEAVASGEQAARRSAERLEQLLRESER